MSDELQPTKRRRIVELDVLWAMAAINLMLFHFTFVFADKYGFSQPIGWSYPFGKYGVELFFMLSGLVNSMTLLSKRKSGDFLVARLIRIGPPFWAVMLVNALLVFTLPLSMSPPTAQQWLANVTIAPGLFGQACIEPVTWTLQIELLFYGLLLLLFLSGWLERPLRTAAWMMAIVLVIELPLRHQWVGSATALGTGLSAMSTVLFLENLPLFFVGILLNEIRRRRGVGSLTLWIGVVVCAGVFHAVDGYGHNPAATALLVAVLALSAFGRLPVLRLRPLVFLSGISYSLYLLHNNLGCTILYHLDPVIGSWPALIVAAGAVVTIAYCSTRFFELPAARFLKAKWEFVKQRRASRVHAALSTRLTTIWRRHIQPGYEKPGSE